jgi:uroporphyrinogen III methyltransferase/synthase
LAARGVRADIVPERSVAESVVEALEGFEVEGRPVLIARAAEARNVIPDALRARGGLVDVLPLYKTVPVPPDPDLVKIAGAADYVTFTSASTVNNLLDALGDDFPQDARVISIGPITSAAVRERGLEVAVEAAEHNPAGLIEALVADANGS